MQFCAFLFSGGESTAYTGRERIYTTEREINRKNIVEVLRKAYAMHCVNASEIEYLWNYYKGKQPILGRTKTVRPEICNKIVENRANEIVSFKIGYVFGDPIQYVGRSSTRRVTKSISDLNELMRTQSKYAVDREIAEWMMVGGVGYRVVLPDDSRVVKIASLDPRKTFVVYSTEMIPRPVLGVSYWLDEKSIPHYSCYTETSFFEVFDNRVSETPHGMGAIPIIEYQANNAMLGSFEIVLPLLDALNTISSNRVDGVEQFVQAFLKFINCNADEETVSMLNEMGAVSVASQQGLPADVDFVSAELNQSQVQTLVDYTYQTILTVCGMPNRNGGSSTSDTGQAVILRDGWSLAEARAKDTEAIFKKSETEFLKILLKLCRNLAGINLEIKDVSIKFTRRNHEDILTKSQVLTTMLSEPKIHPLLAFTHCDMFPDPEEAYTMSEEYYKKFQEGEVNDSTGITRRQVQRGNDPGRVDGGTGGSNPS